MGKGYNEKVEIYAHELQTFLLLAQAVQNERINSTTCLETMASWGKKEPW